MRKRGRITKQDGEEERLKIKKHSFKGTDSMYGKAGHKGGRTALKPKRSCCTICPEWGHAVQNAMYTME